MPQLSAYLQASSSWNFQSSATIRLLRPRPGKSEKVPRKALLRGRRAICAPGTGEPMTHRRQSSATPHLETKSPTGRCGGSRASTPLWSGATTKPLPKHSASWSIWGSKCVSVSSGTGAGSQRHGCGSPPGAVMPPGRREALGMVHDTPNTDPNPLETLLRQVAERAVSTRLAPGPTISLNAARSLRAARPRWLCKRQRPRPGKAGR